MKDYYHQPIQVIQAKDDNEQIFKYATHSPNLLEKRLEKIDKTIDA